MAGVPHPDEDQRAAAASITGRVLRKGRRTVPATGVTVHLKPASRREGMKNAPPPRSTRTRADGRFEPAQVPAGVLLQVEIDDPSSAYRALAFEVPDEDPELRVDLGDIVLEPSTSLLVKVFDPDEAPVTGARVLAQRETSPEDHLEAGIVIEAGEIHGREGPSGEYLFERLPAGAHLVRVHASGFAWGEDSVKLPSDEPLLMSLKAGHRIAGAVLASDGSPVEGALVETEYPALMAVSNSTGEFVFDMLASEDDHEVSVEAEGFISAVRTTLPGKEDLDFWLPREAVFSGTVVSEDDGSPLAGAEVVLSSGEGSYKARTRPDGRFAVKKIPQGAYSLDADHFEFLPVKIGQLDFAEGQKITSQAIPLRKGLSRTVRVVDLETGEPVTAALVGLRSRTTDETSLCRASSLSSGELFTITGLKVGDYSVFHTARNYLHDEQYTVSIAEKSEDLTITLQPGGSIWGRVLDPEGNGVPGARVAVRLPCIRSRENREEIERVYNQADPYRSATYCDRPVESDGSFRILGLATFRRYIVEARHNDYPPATAAGIAVEAGKETGGIEIQLRPGGTIQGRVVDETGGSLNQIDIGAKADEASESTTPDDNGDYEIANLPPGTYLIRASATGRTDPDGRVVELGEGETIGGVDFVFQKGLSVSGDVVDTSGAAIAGAMVTMEVDHEQAVTETDREGRFLVQGFRTGEGLLRTKKVGCRESVVRATVPGGKLLIALEPWSRITGRMEARNARAFPPGSLQAHSWQGRWKRSRWSTIDATGRFDLDLEPGRSMLEASVPGFAPGTFEIALKPGELRELVLPLHSLGSVEGVVMDLTTGDPIESVDVYPGIPGGYWLFSVETDSRGRFRLEDMPAGPVILITWHSGYCLARTAPLQVQSQQISSVRIELRAGQGLQGTVSEQGRPVAGVEVLARGPDAPLERVAVTGPDGLFEVSGLDGGAYKVSLEGVRADGRSFLLERRITVEEGRFTGLDVELSTVRLEGRISAGDSPPTNAKLTLYRPGDSAEGLEAKIDASGDYEVLLPGDGDFLFRLYGPLGLNEHDLLTIPPGTSQFHRDFALPSG